MSTGNVYAVGAPIPAAAEQVMAGNHGQYPAPGNGGHGKNAYSAQIVIAPPAWMRREKIQQYTGIPNHILYDLVRRGLVRSKKLDPGKGGSRLFRVQDVTDYIEELPDDDMSGGIEPEGD